MGRGVISHFRSRISRKEVVRFQGLFGQAGAWKETWVIDFSLCWSSIKRFVCGRVRLFVFLRAMAILTRAFVCLQTHVSFRAQLTVYCLQWGRHIINILSANYPQIISYFWSVKTVRDKLYINSVKANPAVQKWPNLAKIEIFSKIMLFRSRDDY